MYFLICPFWATYERTEFNRVAETVETETLGQCREGRQRQAGSAWTGSGANAAHPGCPWMSRVMLEFVDLCFESLLQLLRHTAGHVCPVRCGWRWLLVEAGGHTICPRQEMARVCRDCFVALWSMVSYVSMCFHVYVKEQWQGMARESLFARFCAGEFEFSPPESCMAAPLKV